MMIYPKGTTEPKKSVASPAQMVAGKDFSNPLMAVDLAKVQQTQGMVDFPTNQTQQNSPGQTEIWDTLGEPNGKFDFLIQKLQESPKNCRSFPRHKKKVVKKKKEDVRERFEIAINKALERVFPKKEDLKEKEIKECLQNPNPEDSQADDDEFGENENEGTNNSDSGMSFSPTTEDNLDT
ncbi:hypothetical protein Adt_22092 [Abeliophyllum distichum]|uniref:Uncharacterized protein n=1 Tax=Abeliophyllum distichum TaxID=126358 RepID=A0ABD1T1F5_9LAMI